MTVKFTMLFGLTTKASDGSTVRTGGWSESWYSNSITTGLGASAIATRLQNKRAAMLPSSAAIVGQRVSNVNPSSGSISSDIVFPGRVGIDCDLPSMALQYTMRSTTGFNERNVELRGTPDDWIKTGEYKANADSTPAIRDFFAALTADGWMGKFVDRTQPRTAIVSISATGVCLCEDAHGLIAGNLVDLQSIIDGGNGKSSIQAIVDSVTNLETVVLRLPYKYRGFEYVGGHIRYHVDRFDTVTITDTEILTPTAVSRKAGRPFKQFRGRRTAKR